MDYKLAAARRMMAADSMNLRARSVISANRPVYCLPDLENPGLVSPADQRLVELASENGASIGRVEIGVTRSASDTTTVTEYIAIATAWPCAGPDGGMTPTRRFVTAGHVLQNFLISKDALPSAGAVQTCDVRPGRVVMPGHEAAPCQIAGWICSAPFDLAVFDIDDSCPAFQPLPLAAPDEMPETVVPIGYPLQEDVGLFLDCLPDYPGHCFIGAGRTRAKELSGSHNLPNFRHDASTCPGYSGAPVLSLATGKVVGVHVWGSADGSSMDWNDAVQMSSILSLDWLAKILNGSVDPLTGDEDTLNWRGGELTRDPAHETAKGVADWRRATQRALLQTLAPRGPFPPFGQGIAFDPFDGRDLAYQPGPAAPEDEVIPAPIAVGDQGSEGSCAAFAVATAIERQLQLRTGYAAKGARPTLSASVRMLDRMARRYDEWLDDTVDGTSLRAVIKGLYHHGVCSWAACPYLPGRPDFFLSRNIAKDARQLTLGRYARISRSVNDMRMAVQECRAVVVTARIHAGWRHPVDGVIAFDPSDPPALSSRHAFVVDGYTDEGFIIQNAQGGDWGGFRNLPGHALWRFDDWAENCVDAWVFRLAPRSAQAFGVSVTSDAAENGPRRIGLLGHIMHAERDGLVEDGTLGLGARGLAETAAYLARPDTGDAYDHLMLIFHDPMLAEAQISRLALTLTLRLKARKIYPFHVVYGLDEMLGCRLRLSHDIGLAAKRYPHEGDPRDRSIERLLAPTITAQIDSFQTGARRACSGALRDAIYVLPAYGTGPADADPGTGPKRDLALVSIGLGGIVARGLIRALPQLQAAPHLAIAPPIAVTKAKCWWLGDLRDESDLPGYLGSWGDMIASAHGRSIRTKRGKPYPTEQEMLADPLFVHALQDHFWPPSQPPAGGARLSAAGMAKAVGA